MNSSEQLAKESTPSDAAGYLRLSGVLDLFPVAKSTWYGLVKLGIAPAPVKIGASSMWRVADVREFLAKDPADLSVGLAKIRSQRRATR